MNSVIIRLQRYCPDVPGSFVQTSWIKNFRAGPGNLEKQMFNKRLVHGPNARTSMTPKGTKKLWAEKLWLIFLSLAILKTRDCCEFSSAPPQTLRCSPIVWRFFCTKSAAKLAIALLQFENATVCFLQLLFLGTLSQDLAQES